MQTRATSYVIHSATPSERKKSFDRRRTNANTKGCYRLSTFCKKMNRLTLQVNVPSFVKNGYYIKYLLLYSKGVTTGGSEVRIPQLLDRLPTFQQLYI